MFLAILANISDIKALGQVEIYLNRGALPSSAQGILKLDVYFRPVKDAFSRVYLIIKIQP